MTKISQRIAGLSLLEMLIAITIMTMLGIGGFSGWHAYQQRQRLEQTSMALMTFLSQIQAEANWRNETFYAAIGQRAERYCITFSTGQKNENCHLDSDSIFWVRDSEITLSSNNSPFALALYGRRNMANGGHLILTNSTGRIRIILSARGRLRRCYESTAGTESSATC